MWGIKTLATLSFFLFAIELHAQTIFVKKNGLIEFVSDAPLEIIEAETSRFQIIADFSTSEFVIKIPIEGFKGFNNALQQEHFYENYLETDKYPEATFVGKFVEPIDREATTFDVLAKGKLTIHGQTVSRIVTVKFTWKSASELELQTNFDVPLADHNIAIPKVIYQKIAEVIHVKASCILIPNEAK